MQGLMAESKGVKISLRLATENANSWMNTLPIISAQQIATCSNIDPFSSVQFSSVHNSGTVFV
jgi:hypothetical protein